MSTFSAIVGGTSSIFLGVVVVTTQKWCHMDSGCIDLGGRSIIVGPLLIIIGILFFFAEIHKRIRKKEKP